ncbi:MAG: bifunctional cobalt-precorrin 5A hydrolase/precorrin-3B C(17)-methyltransferase, partial [Oscillospiraceae bacterium]|nr:bifunctional cobalt-precorrin 5A hydrolase/precorrin-3B C(17)-methyltransferase [Oscillospiraceae bacterium]
MKIVMFAFSPEGIRNMDLLQEQWEKKDQQIVIKTVVKCRAEHRRNEEAPLEVLVKQAFSSADALIFWCAAGIAVRSIAPYLSHKSKDPAVLVLDEKGTHCISLLSGHMGGANALTRTVSELCGAEPVITTGTDMEHRFSVDEFARCNGFVVTDWEKAKRISVDVLAGKTLKIAGLLEKEQYCPVEGMEEHAWTAGELPDDADVWITSRQLQVPAQVLQLIPKDLTIGIGCRRGTNCSALQTALARFLEQTGLDARGICRITSIDRKKEEQGLIDLAAELKVPFVTYTSEELLQAPGEYPSSEFVREITGVDNVCQRSAMLGAGDDAICLAEKTVVDGITMAAACGGSGKSSGPRGMVCAVGIGPGDRTQMTAQAMEVLRRADLIVGYKTYVDQIRPVFPDKEYAVSGMRQEISRIREALEEAAKGKTVAVISSGDASVYGMGGLLWELSEQYDVDVECVAGITAALSGGAVLGAPLGHDFTCISLSDLLTPWDLIRRRLELAAEGDFVIALYNPSSRTRQHR